MAVWNDYTWIVVTGCLAAFFTAYGIGANDVANAFGSSVAARTLTMRQALVIAAVCEFGGSVLLGGEVTRTVAAGIAQLTSFEQQPELYMYGMLCALVSSGTWLIIATYLELPVSTTHSIAGAVLGFAFVFGGPRAVVWLEPQEEFPYMRGMIPIVVSWFVSPLLSGLATALMFLIVRTAILRREKSLELTFWALPVLVMFTVFINVYFVLHKGADTRISWSSNKCAWVAACVAAACTLLTAVIGMPLVRQYVHQDIEARRRQQLSELECHMRVSERCSRGGAGAGGGGSASGGRASGAASAGGSGYPLGHHSRGLRSGGPSAGGAAAGFESELVAGGGGAAAAVAAVTTPHAPGFASPFVEYRAPAAASTARQQAAGRPTGHLPALPPLPVRPARSPYGSFTRSAPGAVAAASDPAGRVVPHLRDPSLVPPPPPAHVQERHLAAPPPLRGGSPPPPPIPENACEDVAAVEEESAAAVAAAPPPLPRTSRGHRRSSSSSAPSHHHHHQQQQQQQANRNDGSGSSGGGAGSSGSHFSIGTASTTSVPQADAQTHGHSQPPAAAREGDEQQQQQRQQWQQQLQHQEQQQQARQHNAPAQPLPEQMKQQHIAAAVPGRQQEQQQMLQLQQIWGPHQLQQQQWLLLQHQLLQQQQQQYWLQQQQQQQQHDQQQFHQPHQQQHQLQAALNWGNALPYQTGQLPAGLLQQRWQAQQLSNPQLWGQLQQQQQQQLQLQLQLQQQQAFQHQHVQQQQGGQQPWGPGHVLSGHQSTANGHRHPELAATVGEAGGQYGISLDVYGSGDPMYGGGASRRLAPPGPIAESLEWGRKSVPEEAGKEAAAGALGADGGQGAGGGGGVAQWQDTFDQLKAIVLHGANVNLHETIIADQVAQRIHAHAEVFDPATEDAFKYLQVVTAICDSFSHGANDVANSVGPFTAIWYIFRHRRVDYSADLPIWILVLGGAGIVLGLATYGYNIIRAIGVRLSAITPSRGFCIELSTAVVVAVASKYGLPISTTHCQVGATAGMGLMEGSSGLHWRLSLQFFLGWVVTLLITGLLSAALFAAGAYAPCIQQGRAIVQYETALLEMTARIDLLLNRTNFAARADPVTWGNFSAALNDSVAATMTVVQLYGQGGSPGATRPVQTIDPGTLMGLLNSTVSSYVNNSAPYIGGMAAQGLALPRRP